MPGFTGWGSGFDDDFEDVQAFVFNNLRRVGDAAEAATGNFFNMFDDSDAIEIVSDDKRLTKTSGGNVKLTDFARGSNPNDISSFGGDGLGFASTVALGLIVGFVAMAAIKGIR